MVFDYNAIIKRGEKDAKISLINSFWIFTFLWIFLGAPQTMGCGIFNQEYLERLQLGLWCVQGNFMRPYMYPTEDIFQRGSNFKITFYLQVLAPLPEEEPRDQSPEFSNVRKKSLRDRHFPRWLGGGNLTCRAWQREAKSPSQCSGQSGVFKEL